MDQDPASSFSVTIRLNLIIDVNAEEVIRDISISLSTSLEQATRRRDLQLRPLALPSSAQAQETEPPRRWYKLTQSSQFGKILKLLTSQLTSRGYICTRNLTSTPIPDTPSVSPDLRLFSQKT